MFPQALLECRQNLDRYRRSWLVRLGLSKCRFQTTANQTPQVAKSFSDLIHSGRIVWAGLVQANEGLFSPGEYDLPGNIVFSPAAPLSESPSALVAIADAVRGLKGRANELAHDPEVQAIAKLITDDVNLAVNQRLPAHLAGGAEVYLSWCDFHRSSLPGGVLAARVVPLLICPEHTERVIVLPLRFWPRGLRSNWALLDEIIALKEPQPMPDAGNRVAQPAFPRQRSTKEILAAYPPAEALPQNIGVTPAAARVIAPILEKQAKGGPAYLHVYLSDGREQIQFVTEWNQAVQECHWSEGIPLLVDREQSLLFRGVVIDFASSPYESGFKFVRADGANIPPIDDR